jgi:murein DD-endopeptidase MepM/ murein hydrolase activator NlpD
VIPMFSMSTTSAASSARRPLTLRLVGLGVAAVTAGSLALAPVSVADTGGDKARLDRGIAQLRSQLEGTSQDLVEAYVALRRTQAQIPAAQRALAAAQTALRQAEQHNRDVAHQLAVARADEAKAAAALAVNAKATETTLDAVGNLARESYQQGSIGAMGSLSVALSAESPDDFATRIATMDHINRLQDDALRDLATMRAEGRAQQAHVVAVRQQVTDLKRQAERAVAAAGAARNAAARAKASLDALSARQAGAARAVAAKQARERSRLNGMQAEADRLQAVLAARARAARERAAHDRASRQRARQAPAADPAPAQGGGFLSKPVNAPVSSEFGYRYHPVLHYSRLHAGIDFAASCGTPVHAAADGDVIMAGWGGGYGNRIVVDHGLHRGADLTTTYNHLTTIVRRGGHVSRGQLIGYSGTTGLSTGCHLHFETRQNGTPVNPRTWF